MLAGIYRASLGMRIRVGLVADSIMFISPSEVTGDASGLAITPAAKSGELVLEQGLSLSTLPDSY